MDWNNALLQLLSQAYRNNFIIISIDYIRKEGLIELDDTPTTIYYNEETKEWI